MKIQKIETKIFEIRGQKVMLDFDLADLYKVETRTLKQAVRRNLDIFPDDFMFKLSKKEWDEVITNCDNLPKTVKFSPSLPFAFTEHGVTMRANVLKSKNARLTSVTIVRAFIALKEFALNHKELAIKLKKLEVKHNRRFKNIYEALKYLMADKDSRDDWKKRKRIGYK